MRRLNLLTSTFLLAAVSFSAPAAAQITVTLGAPGVQTPSRASASLLTFEGTTPAGVTASGFTTSAANAFGGAGGVGNYAMTPATGMLTFTAAPTTYFGAWFSALDGASGIEFFRGSTLIGGFNLRDAFAAAGGTQAYFGNPNATFLGQNAGEAYAYFNFNSTALFDRVNLYGSCCNGSGTIEVDNVAIGIAAVAAVPEPASWAMMIGGLGIVGGAMRRSRSKVTTTVSFA